MRHAIADLTDFATRCLAAAGLPRERAELVARKLVEADAMGHDTHGLAQLQPYVSELLDGRMRPTGEPEIIVDRGAVQVWDGHYLPGIWLTATALEAASSRAREGGVGIVTIRRSHHIGCLQAYLPEIAARGQMALIMCSDPRAATVAPHNGMDPIFSPNPIACGIPTGGDPILIDISSSITTNAMLGRLKAEDASFPGVWARDANGVPTDSPAAVAAQPAGTLLPTGGVDHGHKGFALALMVEALTQALSGYGRADQPQIWGASVMVQVFDPMSFAGGDEFTRQAGFTAEKVVNSRAAPDCPPVRLPGQMALRRKRDAEVSGLELRPDILERLQALASSLAIPAVATEEARSP